MRNGARAAKPSVLAVVTGILAVLMLAVLGFVLKDSRLFGILNDKEISAGNKLFLAGAVTERKNIYDRNYKELAVSFKLSSVYARPLEIQNLDRAVEKLAPLLDLNIKELSRILKAERSFVWLGRHLVPSRAQKIKGFDMQGVYMMDEAQRFYPNHKTAAHVIGFVKDEQGLAGIESFYNEELKGESALGQDHVPGSRKGPHLVLTIDLRAQQKLEDELSKLVRATGASTGMAVVMSTDDGSILALANIPTFDPNRFWAYSSFERRNRAVSDQVYPGGIGRIFRLAAMYDFDASGLDDRGDKPGDPTEAESRKKITAGKRKSAYGAWVRIQEDVLVSPELFGITHLEVRESQLSELAERLGFNQKAGIDLPAPLSTSVRLDRMELSGPDDTDTEMASTTLIHILKGFSALINGGRLVTPNILAGFGDQEITQLPPMRRELGPMVLLPATSRKIRQRLAGGTNSKTGAFFIESLVGGPKLQGFRRSSNTVVNKEEVPQPAGDNGRYHAVMLGAVPAEAPELAIAVVLGGAEINTAQDSPLREMGNTVLPRFRRWRHDRDGNPAEIVTVDRDEAIYKKWVALRYEDDKAATDAGVHKEEQRMPEVRGQSLRRALRQLQTYDVEVKAVGSGQVVRQHPGPGRILQQECVLELERMH